MATISVNLNQSAKVDLIKAMSIRHKAISWDEAIKFTGQYLGEDFILSFRNYHKQRYLIFTHSVGVICFDESNRYITGHDFIGFLNMCFNAMQGIGTDNLYDVLFD